MDTIKLLTWALFLLLASCQQEELSSFDRHFTNDTMRIDYFHTGDAKFENVEIDERILIIRFDAQLHFANTTYFKDKLQEFSNYKGDKLKLLIIDGESLNSLDSSAIYALNEILNYFNRKNIEVAFTGLKGPVRDTINKSELIHKIGVDHCFMSIQEAVDCYESLCNDKPVEKKYQEYIKQSNK